mgnify:CR=1 FL=1
MNDKTFYIAMAVGCVLGMLAGMLLRAGILFKLINL